MRAQLQAYRSTHNIDEAKVVQLVNGATDVKEVGRGGQKIVFRAVLGGVTCVLKFALMRRAEAVEGDLDDVQARATREVETMRECESPYIVKLGPLGLEVLNNGNETVLFFTEEFIDGPALNKMIASGPLDTASTVRLGIQMSHAIAELWKKGKLHRDIKPGNIMQRGNLRDFVLLDAGLAFDIAGDSLSAGFIVGTFAYFSPEQFDYSNRRVLDYRSDLFSLGVTMYEACTGVHPFFKPGMHASRVFSGITTHNPVAPSSIRPDIPAELDAIILKMLGKSPHLRYRKIEQLISDLEKL